MQLSSDDTELLKIILVSGCFACLFFAERLRPSHQAVTDKFRIFRNLSFLPFNSVVSLFFVIPVTLYASSLDLSQRPQVLNHLIIDLLLFDFFIYWWHRANHRLPFLWRFHQVHHYDRMLDTTSVFRFHAGEIILSALVRAVIVIACDISFESVILFEALVMICALFHHSNIVIPKNIELVLSKIIITPSIHWVHHHAKQKETDSNYGTILVIWDHLFQSRSSFKRQPTMTIGIEGTSSDMTFLKLLIKPFTRS